MTDLFGAFDLPDNGELATVPPRVSFAIKDAPHLPKAGEVLAFPLRGDAEGFTATVSGRQWDYDGLTLNISLVTDATGDQLLAYAAANEDSLGTADEAHEEWYVVRVSQAGEESSVY